MNTLKLVGCAAALAVTMATGTATAEQLRYGQSVKVNGQYGQVISQGANPLGGVTVETRDHRGRSTVSTLTPYDQVFRRQLHSATPSFVVGPRNGGELKSFQR